MTGKSMILFDKIFDLKNNCLYINNIISLNENKKKIIFKEILDYESASTILYNKDNPLLLNQLRPSCFEYKNYDPFKIFEDYIEKSTIRLNKGTFKSSYNYKGIGYGRQYNFGAQSITREFRATIMYKYYYDLDLCNAHPTILYNLCKYLKIECHNLEYYINNREEIINECIDENENMSKDDVKNMIIGILYGQTKIYKKINKYDYIEDFYKEYLKIKKIICNLFSNFLKEITEYNLSKNPPKQYNHDGTCLSIILQILENEMIMEIFKYLKTKLSIKNLESICFIYDGLHIPKAISLKTIENKYIPELQDIFINIGCPMILKIKEFEPLDLDCLDKCINYKDFKKVNLISEKEIVQSKKKEFEIPKFESKELIYGRIFNNNHNVKFGDCITLFSEPIYDINIILQFILDTLVFVFNNGESYYVSKNFRREINKDFFNNETRSYELIYQRITWKEIADIKLNYITDDDDDDETINERLAKKTLLYYTKYVQLNITYQYLDFIPFNTKFNYDYNDKDIFNTFTGFKHEYEKDFIINMDYINIFLEHIKVICNYQEDLCEYLLEWICDIIQNPHILSEIRIILQSDEGAGKNIFFYILMNHVIGSKFCVIIDDIEKATGRFNGVLSEKLLMVFDEACNINNSAESHKQEQKMKSITTNPEILVEKKGKECITIKNYCRNVSLTNNDFAGKVGRRPVFIKMSNEKIGDKDYFDKVATLLSDDCGKHIFHYLSNYEIKINLKKKIITKYEMELQIQQSDPIERWLIQWLSGYFDDIYYLKNIDIYKVNDILQFKLDDLFESFNLYCIDIHKVNTKNKDYFSRLFSKILNKKAERETIDKNKYRVYYFTINELKNIYIKKFKNENLFVFDTNNI